VALFGPSTQMPEWSTRTSSHSRFSCTGVGGCLCPSTVLNYWVRLSVFFRSVRFEVFTTMTIRNGVFNDVTPCGSCKNRRSYCASVASYDYLPSSPIIVTLMMEALSSSKTSVLTGATRRDIPEDAILHSHRREDLKSYKTVYC
jgi:hypothetical protein